ncbi:MAG TPA: nucleotide-binding protein [Thermoanaerobaculia bacterium]|jgi:hypothetical protein
MQKPRVFIGSSSEGLPIAQAVLTRLARTTIPTLWSENVFTPGTYPLEALDDAVRDHSFAVLVASPDDEVMKRGIANRSMRDNVMLEFGLFVGAFGRRRVFFVAPSQPRIELPSDLAGLTVATYDPTLVTDQMAVKINIVREACEHVQKAIRRECQAADLLQRKRQVVLRASIQVQAIRRLAVVATQFRDSLWSVQRESVGSLTNLPAFEKAKRAVANEVANLTDSLRADAKIVGVQKQLEELRRVTIAAILALPFPKELMLGKSAATRKAIKVGREALRAVLRGNDPVSHVRAAAAAEIGGRLSALSKRYETWWAAHCPRLQTATVRLHDALFDRMLALRSTP